MIPYLGDFVEDDVVYIMFNTFTSDDPSASSTITNFVSTDVHIHKDDGLTQRNNAAGITVSVNFDGITGSHLIKIDTNDNTVAGFWVTGHDYFVRIEGTTVDAATINAVVGHFSIQNRYTRGTNSAALAATALSDATWTDAKAGHLDAPISTVDTVVDGIQTDLSNVTDGLGALKALLDTISGYTDKIDDATNGLTAIKAEVEGLAGAAMRGTDGANTTVPDAAGVAPTAAEIKTEVEQAGSSLAQILADTNELELDWKNGGRLDNLLDAIPTTAMRGTDGANTTVPDAAGVAPTAVEIQTQMEGAGSKLLAIEGDTNELQTDWKNTGRLDNLLDAIPTTAMRGTDSANTTVPDAAGVAPTAAEIKTEVEQAGSSLAQILADTNELELDWKNGGRLDLILDIIAADTTTNIPGLILKYTQLLARSDAAITTDNATELTAINADGGSGAGDFSNQDDGIEAIRDRGDAAWTTGSVTGLSPLATGTAQDGAAGSIMLAAGASAKNDLYKGARILITGGTGTEQSRIITAYDGTTKVASVAPNWVTTPNATSTYEIQAADSNVGAIQNDGQGATDLKDFVSGGLLQKVKGIVETILATVSS
jgi:hypothetical protein